MTLDNITFVDLVALTRITPEATVERFGGLINSSFFDASNILGTLKQKGLVDFITQFPSQSAINVTEQGKQLISEVQEKSSAPFDTLDMAVLLQLADGKRSLPDLSTGVNVTPKDLATHLYKLSVQQYISYEIRNGNMNLTMTEKGFLRVKEGMPKPGEAQQPQQPQSAMTGAMAAQQFQAPSAAPQIQGTQERRPETQAPAATPEEVKSLETRIQGEKKLKSLVTIVVIVLLVIVLSLLYFEHLI
jgi:hypothetical protein